MNDDKVKKYEEYFKESLEQLDIEFQKSKEYSKKIDNEISKFDSLTNKGPGVQRYLIDHIKNAIALQAQRQSIIKDKFAIRKAVMDYTVKSDNTDTETNKSLFDELNKIIKASQGNTIIDTNDLPKDIDDKIDETVKGYDVDD